VKKLSELGNGVIENGKWKINVNTIQTMSSFAYSATYSFTKEPVQKLIFPLE